MEICVCPKSVLNRIPLDADRLVHLNFLVSAAAVLALAPLLGSLPHVCLAQWLLRIPCPGCGITHSLCAMGHLDFRNAWHWNPAAIPLAVFLVLQFLFRSIALWKPFMGQMITRGSRLAGRFVWGSLLIVWFARLLRI